METQAVIDVDWAAPKNEDESEDDQGPPVAFLICGSDEHPLYAGDNLVGRGAGQDVTLPEHTVSDTHALLICSNDEVTVKDLKSSNGTFVESWPPGSRNFEKVQKRATVPCSSGCSVRFGTVECVLDIRVLSNETQALDLGMYMPSSQSPDKEGQPATALPTAAPQLPETQPPDGFPALPPALSSSPTVVIVAPAEGVGSNDSDAESEATLHGNDTSMHMDAEANTMATAVDDELEDRPPSTGSSRRVSGLAALIDDSDDDDCRSELSEPIVQVDQEGAVTAGENQELLVMFDEVEENPIALDDEGAECAEDKAVISECVESSSGTVAGTVDTSPMVADPQQPEPPVQQPSPELITRPSVDTPSTPATLLDSVSTLPTISSPNRLITVPVLEHKTSSLSVTPALEGIEDEPGQTNTPAADMNIAEQPTVDRRAPKNSLRGPMAVPLTPVSERQAVVAEDMISPLAVELQCGVTRSPAPVLTLPGSFGRSTDGWMPKKNIPESIEESTVDPTTPPDVVVNQESDADLIHPPDNDLSPFANVVASVSGVPAESAVSDEGDQRFANTMQVKSAASSSEVTSPGATVVPAVPNRATDSPSDLLKRTKNTRSSRTRAVFTAVVSEVHVAEAPHRVPVSEDNEPLDTPKRAKNERGSRTRGIAVAATEVDESPSGVPAENAVPDEDEQPLSVTKPMKGTRSSRTRSVLATTGEGEPVAKRQRIKAVTNDKISGAILPVQDSSNTDHTSANVKEASAPDSTFNVYNSATSRGRRSKRGKVDDISDIVSEEAVSIKESKAKCVATKRKTRLAADDSEPSIQATSDLIVDKSKKSKKALPVSNAAADISSQVASATESSGPQRRSRGSAVEEAAATQSPPNTSKRPRENPTVADSDATKRPARSSRNAVAADVVCSPSVGKTEKGVKDIRVLFTSIEPLPHLIRKIGAIVVDDAACATHVVTISSKQFKRTPKLMLALNSGADFVVGEEWLRDSAKSGIPLPLDDDSSMSKYIVRDTEKEDRWKFNMVETLTIPRGGRGIGVFTGISFYIADGVCGACAPPLDEMRAIIESGNGTLIPKSLLTIDNDPQHSLQSLVVIVAPPAVDSVKKGRTKSGQPPRRVQDAELQCLQYSTISKDKKGKVRVYYPEFLFLACMRQRLDFTANFELIAS